jgi:RimJ/RimL family protein N-acetyltransferase
VSGPLAGLPCAPRGLPAGQFALRIVRLENDLDLVHGWMNDPQVAAFWELDGPRERTEQHLIEQASLDYTAAYLGLLDGEPMSYWEVYRADLDPLLAGRYPARPHDTGLHVLIGPRALRGRGIGSALLRDLASRALAADPQATRVLAEPDVRNVASVRAFARAGFRVLGIVELAAKRAALLARERDGPPPGGSAPANPGPGPGEDPA